MAKSYPDRLAEWVKQKQATGRAKNLVAFLAVRDDVRAAVESGYPVTTVWANMRDSGRIDFSYEAFLRYVNRLVRQSPEPRPKATPTGTSTKAPAPTDARREAGVPATDAPAAKADGPPVPDKSKAGSAGFVYNPIVNKEELF